MIAVEREPKPRGRGSRPGEISQSSPSRERASVSAESPTICSAPEPSSALAARLANGLRSTWGPEGEVSASVQAQAIQADVQLVETTGPNGRRLSYLGVHTCKSSLCPMCATKWQAVRADEITQAVTYWGPARCRMVTFTMKHHQECTGRDTELLGERAGIAAPDADLGPVLADVVTSAEAASTRSAAEHGVARDATTDPAVLRVGADGRDGAAPLVSWSHGVGGVSLSQVLHLAAEELGVGATDADPRHVDHDVVRPGLRVGNLLHFGPAGAGQDEGVHLSVARSRSCAGCPGRRCPAR